MDSSPFITTQVLAQIANNETNIGSEIREAFYADDHISESDNKEQANIMKNRLAVIMQSYGLPLRKVNRIVNGFEK